MITKIVKPLTNENKTSRIGEQTDIFLFGILIFRKKEYSSWEKEEMSIAEMKKQIKEVLLSTINDCNSIKMA